MTIDEITEALQEWGGDNKARHYTSVVCYR